MHMAVRPINKKLNRSSPLRIWNFPRNLAVKKSAIVVLFSFYQHGAESMVRFAEHLMTRDEVIQNFAISLPHACLL